MEVKKASIKDSIEDRYLVNVNSISYDSSPKGGLYGFKKYRNYNVPNKPIKVDATTGDNDILS